MLGTPDRLLETFLFISFQWSVRLLARSRTFPWNEINKRVSGSRSGVPNCNVNHIDFENENILPVIFLGGAVLVALADLT